MKNNRDKGFTLAELLIVVAIIGVLVAISIPILSNQREKAIEAVTISTLRSAYSKAALARSTEDYSDPDLRVRSTGTGINNTIAVVDISFKGGGSWTYHGDMYKKLPFAIAEGNYDLMRCVPGTYYVMFTWNDDGTVTATGYKGSWSS